MSPDFPMTRRNLTDKERAAGFRVLAVIFAIAGIVLAFDTPRQPGIDMLVFAWLSLIYARTLELGDR